MQKFQITDFQVRLQISQINTGLAFSLCLLPFQLGTSFEMAAFSVVKSDSLERFGCDPFGRTKFMFPPIRLGSPIANLITIAAW